MLLTTTTSASLRAWLVARFGPITDADPSILADYALALLKHDVPRDELATLLSQSLADFVRENESTASLTSDLLSRLDALMAEEGGATRGTKRPSSIPSLDPDGPVPKFARTDRSEPRPIPSSAAGPPRLAYRPAQPRARQQDMCRDYHFRGFCARGEQCIYMHEPTTTMPAPVPGPAFSAPFAHHGGPRSSNILVIEHIPPEAMSAGAVRDFFGRFGAIDDVRMDEPRMRALVTFGTRDAAKAAHSSPAPVWDNRFVKVFFARAADLEPGPQPSALPVGFAPPFSAFHHGPQAAASSSSQRHHELAAIAMVEGSSASTGELRNTLESLRQEAAALGVDSSSPSRTFKLDLRPKQLHIELGADADASAVQARLSGRGAHSIAPLDGSDRSLLVTFDSHESASQVLAAGADAEAGLAAMRWHAADPAPAADPGGAPRSDTVPSPAADTTPTMDSGRHYDDEDDETGWKR